MTDKVPAILVKQGDRQLLLFSLPAKELLALCYFNSREVDRQEGVQREFNRARSRQIAEFIDEADACLANNIVVNIDLKALGLGLEDVYSREHQTLDLNKLRETVSRLTDKRPSELHGKCAFVIDGQHRLRAFEFAKQEAFPLVVTALVDMSLAEVAELFVQINFNQKPVNKSLVYDLLGISPAIFPEYRDLHDLVTRLNDDVESPFYCRIKMLGVGEGTISQASIISAVEKYRVRETLKLILREEVSQEILYNVIWNYFTGVSKAFAPDWVARGKICKTMGVRAFFIVMTHLLKHFNKTTTTFSATEIELKMNVVDIEQVFKRAEGFGGEKGVRELANLILVELGLGHE